MKKLSFLFLSALALGMSFTSCSKDDDSTPGSVVGKWNYSKTSTSINGQLVAPEADYDGNEAGCNKDYVEILESGVYNEVDFDGVDCDQDLDAGTWVKNGATLTVTSNGETDVMTVVSVSSTVLKMKFSYTEQGITITQNVTFTKE